MNVSPRQANGAYAEDSDPLSGRQRSQVRRNRDDVVFRQLRDHVLHERRPIGRCPITEHTVLVVRPSTADNSSERSRDPV